MSAPGVIDYLEQANRLASTLSGDEKAKARAEVARAKTAAIQAGRPDPFGGVPTWLLIVGGVAAVVVVVWAVAR